MKQKKHQQPSTGQGLGASAQREIRDKLQQVTVLLQAQRLAQADYLCQEVLKKYPQAAQAWYFRGAIAHQAKKPTDAMAHLRQALALAPAQAPYWQALAAVQMAVGDGAGAVQSHTQAVEANPQDSKAHFQLAMALAAVGEGGLAVEAYGRVLALEPRHWTAAFNRGLLHQKRNDHAAAVDDFTRVLQLRPGETSTYYSLGLSLRHLERYGEALDAFEKVFTMAGDSDVRIQDFDMGPADDVVHTAQTQRDLREVTSRLEMMKAAVSLRENPAHEAKVEIQLTWGAPEGAPLEPYDTPVVRFVAWAKNVDDLVPSHMVMGLHVDRRHPGQWAGVLADLLQACYKVGWANVNIRQHSGTTALNFWNEETAPKTLQ